MISKLIALAVLAWAVATYNSVTLGGLVHLVPAAALVLLVMRRMAKEPDTAYGRWRAPRARPSRR